MGRARENDDGAHQSGAAEGDARLSRAAEGDAPQSKTSEGDARPTPPAGPPAKRTPARRAPGRANRQLTASDWTQAAFEAFVAGGSRAVAVEPIAKILGVSKGSFYWHFGNRDELFAAVLDMWLARTDELIAVLSAPADPRERLQLMLTMVYGDMTWTTVEIDLLTHMDDPAVRRVVEAATEARLTFMTDTLIEAGMDAERARIGALQGYSMWMGVVHLMAAVPSVLPTRADRERFADSTWDLIRTLLAAPAPGPTQAKGEQSR